MEMKKELVEVLQEKYSQYGYDFQGYRDLLEERNFKKTGNKLVDGLFKDYKGDYELTFVNTDDKSIYSLVIKNPEDEILLFSNIKLVANKEMVLHYDDKKSYQGWKKFLNTTKKIWEDDYINKLLNNNYKNSKNIEKGQGSC